MLNKYENQQIHLTYLFNKHGSQHIHSIHIFNKHESQRIHPLDFSVTQSHETTEWRTWKSI